MGGGVGKSIGPDEKGRRGRMTKYLLTMPDCPECIARKEELELEGVDFVEVDGQVLAGFGRRDAIDLPIDIQAELLASLSMANGQMPVEVDLETGGRT